VWSENEDTARKPKNWWLTIWNLLRDRKTSPAAFPAIGCIQPRARPEDVEAAKEFLAQPLPQDPEDKEDQMFAIPSTNSFMMIRERLAPIFC
jgi:hypothetical protein